MTSINESNLKDFNDFLVEKGFNPISAVKTIKELRLIQKFLFEIDGEIIFKTKSDLVKEYYSKARVIEKECEYCQGNKYLIENDNNGFHVLEIAKADDVNKYGLVIITPFGLYSEEINYCPMCGKKLVQDER